MADASFSRAGRSYLRTTMDGELKRGLSSRHMNMIAIGGAIGTGLFVASGATISQAGPGGALVAYFAMGLMAVSYTHLRAHET